MKAKDVNRTKEAKESTCTSKQVKRPAECNQKGKPAKKYKVNMNTCNRNTWNTCT